MKTHIAAVAGFGATLALAAAVLAGEAATQPSKEGKAEKPGKASVAVADVQSLAGSNVRGKVKFTERDGMVTIEAEIDGLTPGDHGFHIHEFGDCSIADGSSAGGHFNPAAAAHGPFDKSAPHHAGDLGNLHADEKGRATLKGETSQFTLGEGAANILGRAVIIHEKADDLATQPSGNAGARLACGMVKLEGGNTQAVKKPAP